MPTNAHADPPASAPDDEIAGQLLLGGLDQIWPFDVSWLSDETRAALGAGATGRALLVANSRALWPALLRAVAEEMARDGALAPDPLQRYVEAQIDAALATRPGARAAYGHRGPPFIPLQRIAAESGFGWLSPGRLIVHPALGPWVALRAVLVGVGGDAPAGGAPQAPACSACQTACVPAFEQASGSNSWRDWLAVRAACPRGAEWRYDDAQVQYHYTKDLGILAEAAADRA